MEFREPLPAQCPPANAVDAEIELAYRVVWADPPTERCFASQAAKGLPPSPGADPCRHRSCSLFIDLAAATNIAYRLPKPRESGPLIATLSIPEGAGRHCRKRKHVDWWIYKSFDPAQAVTGVENA